MQSTDPAEAAMWSGVLPDRSAAVILAPRRANLRRPTADLWEAAMWAGVNLKSIVSFTFSLVRTFSISSPCKRF